MQTRAALVSVSLLASLTAAPASFAADWPDVKVSAKGAVPQCATSGRLMAMAKARNPNIDKRFEAIAADYKRHGEALGIRWDYVFFQMLQETGDLSFKTGTRSVKAEQNNFAGLGAAKDGDAGERFADVSTGVRAHIEHVMIYAGLPVENPVAERTRKVQQWGIIKPVDGRAATFGDVVGRWAPKSKPYAEAITTAAKQFDAEFCKKADPQPERIAAAPVKSELAKSEPVKSEPARTLVTKIEPKAEMQAKTTEAAPKDPAPKVSGADLAKKAINDARTDPSATRSSLGAGLAKAGTPPVKILNEPVAPAEQKPVLPEQKPQVSKTALPPAATQKASPQQAVVAQKCRVWTASYGGDKALIIRSAKEDTINFTVLDVNAGQEKREADAYIAAYAPGGKIEAEFANQTQALDKAFDLCPEG
jgi:Mannosyl-glycoprotein endo-beta-N-acetylglucosaminidase